MMDRFCLANCKVGIGSIHPILMIAQSIYSGLILFSDLIEESSTTNCIRYIMEYKNFYEDRGKVYEVLADHHMSYRNGNLMVLL